jgi:hypothetical protein
MPVLNSGIYIRKFRLHRALVGAGIVVAAFFAWLIVRRILQKKRNVEIPTPLQEAVSPPEQPKDSERNGEADEKDE